MIYRIAVVIILRLIKELLLMARIMVIWRSLVHQLDSIAVAEDQRKGVQFFFFFSADYGRTFIYKIVAEEYSTPERFSKLKVVVANDGVYLRDESQKESVYSHPIGLRDLYSVNKLRFSDGALISVYDDWQNEIAGLVKEELIRKKYLTQMSMGQIFAYLIILEP